MCVCVCVCLFRLSEAGERSTNLSNAKTSDHWWVLHTANYLHRSPSCCKLASVAHLLAFLKMLFLHKPAHEIAPTTLAIFFSCYLEFSRVINLTLFESRWTIIWISSSTPEPPHAVLAASACFETGLLLSGEDCWKSVEIFISRKCRQVLAAGGPGIVLARCHSVVSSSTGPVCRRPSRHTLRPFRRVVSTVRSGPVGGQPGTSAMNIWRGAEWWAEVGRTRALAGVGQYRRITRRRRRSSVVNDASTAWRPHSLGDRRTDGDV